jgi:ubiquinone/menaquinone biosynthesis C-methylase UbiE
MTSYFGISEEEGRKEYLCRLELGRNAKILEVSVGTGANIPYLLRYGNGAEFYGLDLSPGMLAQCAKNVQKWTCQAELFHGLAERLPFRDGSFDVVFHIGGINAFEEKKQAIEEMIRVAKPGTKILIVDEWFSPKRLRHFHERLLLRAVPAIARRTEPPIDRIPADMLETKLEAVWNGYGYCLEFRKPV